MQSFRWPGHHGMALFPKRVDLAGCRVLRRAHMGYLPDYAAALQQGKDLENQIVV